MTLSSSFGFPRCRYSRGGIFSIIGCWKPARKDARTSEKPSYFAIIQYLCQDLRIYDFDINQVGCIDMRLPAGSWLRPRASKIRYSVGRAAVGVRSARSELILRDGAVVVGQIG
jgi:hypothetical protein